MADADRTLLAREGGREVRGVRVWALGWAGGETENRWLYFMIHAVTRKVVNVCFFLVIVRWRRMRHARLAARHGPLRRRRRDRSVR